VNPDDGASPDPVDPEDTEDTEVAATADTVDVQGDAEVDDGADDGAELTPDLAYELLARTRGDHLPANERRRRSAGRSRYRPGDRPQHRRDAWSGARPDALDPVPVGAVLQGFVAARGWDETMAQARVLADWATIVGSDVAAHCSPVSLARGELKLSAESTAWATQLRMLESTMVRRIEEQVGRGVVTRISVTGPVAPSWRHGMRTVPGARGPRDTYG
jgi:predicted nucleic acid-binding Zn ribbon protein